MITLSVLKEKLNGLIVKNGYFIISTTQLCKHGEFVEDVMHLEGHKLVVVGEASIEEFEVQVNSLESIDQTYWGLIKYKYPYFYKVTAE